MARVLVPFRDRETWVAYRPGDDYAGTPERLRELERAGIVQSGLVVGEDEKVLAESTTEAQRGNLDGLSVAELRALAAERGIAVPKRASKARLVEMVGG